MADDTRAPAPRVPRCPACGRPRDDRFRPFCSARCRDADLIGWLDGRYAIPVVETEPDDDAPRDDGPPAR